MRLVEKAVIEGPIDRVYELAARVEEWPAVLPHYRSVRVLADSDGVRTVAMRCVRQFGPVGFPCRWIARQEAKPAEGRILFHHLAGPARGMDVEWLIRQSSQGVEATIEHRYDLGRSKLHCWYADYIIGQTFVQAIAGRTLTAIKRIVEAEGAE